MSRPVMCALVCAALATSLWAATSRAGEPAKATKQIAPPPSEVVKHVTVKGTVSVTRDEKGEIKSCELIGSDGVTYICGPMAECKKLAEYNGKTVECVGKVTPKDGDHHLHIVSVMHAKW
jgi:hypothetical protein